MENWEEQNFNSEWREALQGGEATPSGQVWKNIDTRLMLAENITMKKRMVFYQRMAAASVGVLFLVSGYAFWNSSSNNEHSIARNNQVKSATDKNAGDRGDLSSDEKVETSQVDASSELLKGSNSSNEPQPVFTNNNHIEVKSTSENDVVIASPIEIIDNRSAVDRSHSESVAVNPAGEQMHFQFSPRKLDPELPKKAKLNDLVIAYRLADAMPAIHKKRRKKTSTENSWVAMGLAAGSYSQSISNLDIMKANSDQYTGLTSVQNTYNSSKGEKSRPGSSFSMSFFGGKRLAKRWLLQAGLNYLNENTQSNTSTIEVASANTLDAKNSTTSFAPENAKSVTYTTNSQINSTFQFISLPVQAGYMLVDQKLGVQLNGGISPDVFLRSSVCNKASGEEEVSSTGSSNTFKTLSISGLGGVEVSYRIAERYRISLVPGVRYSLTPVYKENSLASSKPFTADIGLRLRYMFN